MEGFNRKCDDCVTRLAESMNTSLELLQAENVTIDGSQLARDVRGRMEGSSALKDVLESFTPTATTAGHKGTIAELMASVQELAKVGGKNMPKEWVGVLRSSNVIDAASKLVGMVNRDLVLKLGRSLGYKFRPWQAAKLSAKLAKAVPLLNLAAAAWEIESHRREKRREEEAARELRQFKTDVKAMLGESAGKITQAVHAQLVSNVEKVMVGSLELLKEKKSKLATYAKEYKEGCKELEARRSQCNVAL